MNISRRDLDPPPRMSIAARIGWALLTIAGFAWIFHTLITY